MSLSEGVLFFLRWADIPRTDSSSVIARIEAKRPDFFPRIDTGLRINRTEESFVSTSEALKTPWEDECRKLARGLGLTPRAFWPGGAPYAFCMTHDLDRIFASYHALSYGLNHSLTQSARFLANSLLSMLPGFEGYNPYCSLRSLQDFEMEMGVPSCLFVLFEKRRWQKTLKTREIQHSLGVYSPDDIVDELKRHLRGGGEIGIHASFDAWCDTSALLLEKNRLESLIGAQVFGCRNHYLNFDSTATLQAQDACGIQYDSTIGFNHQVGFRSGTSFPYQMGNIMEVPLTLMDSALQFLSPSVKARLPIALQVQDSVRASGGVMVINWHPHFSHLRYFQEWVNLMETLILKARSDGAWITTPRKVVEWWRGRGQS